MRVNILRITPEFILETVKTGFHPPYVCIKNALPEDARIISIDMAPPQYPSELWIKIESKEFEEVLPMEVIPFAKKPVFKRLKPLEAVQISYINLKDLKEFEEIERLCPKKRQ